MLVILIDDVGFGASSAFGGPCHTPNFERLAAAGLKYNRFHTTALCSPTRSALLTGATTTRWAWATSPCSPLRAGQLLHLAHTAEIDLGLDDHKHMIKPEDRVNLAMAFQSSFDVARGAAEASRHSDVGTLSCWCGRSAA